MENSLDEVTELLGSDLALSTYADAAGVADHLAHHVLCFRGRSVCVLLLLSEILTI